MKRTTTGVLIVLSILFLQCEDANVARDQGALAQHPEINKTSPSARVTDGSGSEYSDWSGQVKMKIFVQAIYGQHNSWQVSVSDEYVLAGGGAYVLDWDKGAYLTESRPNTELTTWYASSKDHLDADIHTLVIVAIGIRIEGIPAWQLRQNMQVFGSSGGTSSHPTAITNIPTSHLFLCGGAKVNYTGQGNHLVRCGNQNVESKDHIVGDPATIFGYAIGIKKTISGFGDLQVIRTSNYTDVSSGVAVANSSLPAGYVICGASGEASYTGYGRMLMGIRLDIDNPSGSSSMSKDHRKASGGRLYSYSYGISKKP